MDILDSLTILYIIGHKSSKSSFSFLLKPAFAVDTGWVRVTPGQLAMMRKIALTWEAGGGMWLGPGPPWSPGCPPISSRGLMAPSLARVHLPQERGLLP